MSSVDEATAGGRRRRQATPVELAALLVDAVCLPGEGETDAVGELSAALELRAESVREELLYLRAFAVDFAVQMGLGDSPPKRQILSRYYEHWRRLDQQAGGGALAALEERLQDYADAVRVDPHGGRGGLAEEVGEAFAVRCATVGGAASTSTELALLGGRLFAAIYDEVVGLLTEVEIVLLEE